MLRPIVAPLVTTTLLVAAALLPGCSSGSTPLTVFAAMSLADAFQELGATFERTHPGAEIAFNFAGSSTLRTQLGFGARADIFASADTKQMMLARRAGVVEEPSQVFATNSLVLVTPIGNQEVRTLQDLSKPSVRLVLALPEVPAGAYARLALDKMEASLSFDDAFSRQVLANLVSEEINVRQVLAKVILGEADAGIVYSSDVTANVARTVRTIPIPPEFNVLALYPVAVPRTAQRPVLAHEFINFLGSPYAQVILASYGFEGIS